MSTKRVIGIDPGLSGAVAILGMADDLVEDLPIIGKEVNPQVLANTFATQTTQSVIVIEEQQARPRDGCKQAFRTGMNYGILKSVAMLADNRVEVIRPAVWKKEFGLIKKDKEASRLKAIELFPKLADQMTRKKDHGRAEALLIAEYGKRKFAVGNMTGCTKTEQA